MRRTSAATVAVLAAALASLAGAASPAAGIRVIAGAAKITSSAGKRVVLTAHVPAAGVYAVTVDVHTQSAAPDVVTLRIEHAQRTAVTRPGSDSATVTAQVVVRGHRLVIRARAQRGTATIDANWRLVGPLDSSTSSNTTGASGATGATGATGSTAPSGPPGDPSSWHVIFDDEFNNLNTAVWTTSRYDDGQSAAGFNDSEQECLDPRLTTVAGGEADIRLLPDPETCGGEQRPFTGGVLDTDGKWSFTYGYVEARVWLPSDAGQIADWPTVWAVGDNWPFGGEIDIVEGLGGSGCWHFHDPLGGPGGCPMGEYAGGWHTFAADWEPGSVTWYYDGEQVGTLTEGVTSSPMQLILDVAVAPGDPLRAPATMRVDYVRIWQH